MRFLTIGILVASLAASGCMGFGGDLSDKYDDANSHYGDKFNGGVADTKSVSIPTNTGNLRVALAIETAGGVNIALKNPLGVTVEEVNRGGTVEIEDSSWYEAQNPSPGTWRLEVNAGGTGSYGAGFYYS